METSFRALAKADICVGKSLRISNHFEIPISSIIVNKENGSRTILHYRGTLPEINAHDFARCFDAETLNAYGWIHFEGFANGFVFCDICFCRQKFRSSLSDDGIGQAATKFDRCTSENFRGIGKTATVSLFGAVDSVCGFGFCVEGFCAETLYEFVSATHTVNARQVFRLEFDARSHRRNSASIQCSKHDRNCSLG